MKTTVSTLALLLFCCIAASAQYKDTISGSYNLTGKVTDVSGTPIAGANLYFKKGDDHRTFSTNIDGTFSIGLQPGSYEIEVNKSNSRSFHAFVVIASEGLNPSDVTFVLDPDDACCMLADARPYPKPIVLPSPPYPPAARAVRATGEIEVEITVEPDGTVSAASALTGHPLLRHASVAAARSAKFEPSLGSQKRNLVLTYVYMNHYETNKVASRYKNAYRIEIFGAELTING